TGNNQNNNQTGNSNQTGNTGTGNNQPGSVQVGQTGVNVINYWGKPLIFTVSNSQYVVPASGQMFINLNPVEYSFSASVLGDNRDSLIDAADQVWDYAETLYKEKQSAALLAGMLEEYGFSVQRGVAGIPTAFVAEYGSGGPVIGILGEYDALPGLSQDKVPY